MTDFSEVAKKLRKIRHLADAPSLMSDLGYPYYLTRTGYRHLPPFGSHPVLTCLPRSNTYERTPGSDRLPPGISRHEKRLRCAALEGGKHRAVGRPTLGILEWSYTAWIVLIVHVFGGWEQFPFYNNARSGNRYDFGFVLGAGSPILGSFGGWRTRRGD